MKVIIAVPALSSHDAIGTDVSRQYRAIEKRFPVHAYAHLVHQSDVPLVEREAFEELLADPQNLLIYHHSILWDDGEALLSRCRSRVIVKYHNITPPSYFRRYNGDFFQLCRDGRRQTGRLKRLKPDAWWAGDSRFNLQDAGVSGRPRSRVLPPFNKVEQWQDLRPDPELLRRLIETSCVNLLFVGRLVPNKGLRFMLRIIEDYVAHYDGRIRLHVVGKRDPRLPEFYDDIDAAIARLGIDEMVNWAGEVDDATLLAYYLGCDFYLSCSEHEGFCIPVVESQALHLPVLTRAAGATPETVGPDQIVLGDDVGDYSAAIRLLAGDPAGQESLSAAGRRNYESRFSAPAIESALFELIEDATRATP